MTLNTTADEIIAALGMQPHPEGGHYVETFRDSPADGRRGVCTAIYFLLQEDEVSQWHRVDAVEIWHWYAGAPLRLDVSEPGRPRREILLGNDILGGEVPQGVVPADAWQSAQSLGAWSLVGCTVSPAFHFSGFEMAAPGWEPPG